MGIEEDLREIEAARHGGSAPASKVEEEET